MVYFFGIFPFAGNFCAKRSNINNRRNPCKILHQYTRRFKGNIFIRPCWFPV